MEFNKNRPIYLQIADFIMENILLETWKVDERIPAVRELATNIEVNPNTVMRAYRDLDHKGILYNKRGVGFFVAKGASRFILNDKRKMFLKVDIPSLFAKMDLLGIDIEEILKLYNKR